MVRSEMASFDGKRGRVISYRLTIVIISFLGQILKKIYFKNGNLGFLIVET